MVIALTVACHNPMLALKKETTETRETGFDVSTDLDNTISDDDPWYLCRQCRRRLTQPGVGVRMNGSHTHTFANPGGLVFEIACFSKMVGFRLMGPPSTEFTWFAGHAWQVVICAGCGTHTGWFFANTGGNRFFGLIRDRLVLYGDRQGG